jgi:hypothetical protein
MSTDNSTSTNGLSESTKSNLRAVRDRNQAKATAANTASSAKPAASQTEPKNAAPTLGKPVRDAVQYAAKVNDLHLTLRTHAEIGSLEKFIEMYNLDKAAAKDEVAHV